MSKELKADISLLLITIFWGASFPIMKFALRDIGPLTLVVFRNGFGAILLTIIFYKRFRNINMRVIKGAVLIGLSLLIGCVFQVMGLLYTTSSKSGFITGLNVVFVPIIISVIYKKKPDSKTIIGIILSVIGLALISLNNDYSINIGDVFTLLGAFVFSFQILFVDKYGKGVDVLLLTCLELWVVGILGIIPAIGFEGLHMNLNAFSIGALIFTTVFCTTIAMCVQNKMQPYTNPTHAAIIYLAEPVFGAIFSTFVGDILSLRGLIGCILIFMGMLVVSIKLDKK